MGSVTKKLGTVMAVTTLGPLEPLESQPQVVQNMAIAMPQTGKRARILVVEDDPILSGIYRSALGLGEFAVECAADGLEALDKIEAARPGLIILDIALPIIDGWAVLERLRSTPDCPPVVVVSSAADLDRAKRLGAVACYSKPFRFAELRATCQEILYGAANLEGNRGPILVPDATA